MDKLQSLQWSILHLRSHQELPVLSEVLWIHVTTSRLSAKELILTEGLGFHLAIMRPLRLAAWPIVVEVPRAGGATYHDWGWWLDPPIGSLWLAMTWGWFVALGLPHCRLSTAVIETVPLHLSATEFFQFCKGKNVHPRLWLKPCYHGTAGFQVLIFSGASGAGLFGNGDPKVDQLVGVVELYNVSSWLVWGPPQQ